MIGSMLPCNVVVQEFDNHQVEVAAVNPIASMQAVENPALLLIATTIQNKLRPSSLPSDQHGQT